VGIDHAVAHYPEEEDISGRDKAPIEVDVTFDILDCENRFPCFYFPTIGTERIWVRLNCG